MFDLETAIAEWRQQLLGSGIKSSTVLDELESHLREEMDRRMRTASDLQQAFDIATARIGDTALLKKEFRKIETPERTNMMRTIAILLALFGMVFGLAMVLPALGQWSHTGVLHSGPLLIGTILLIAGGIAALCGIRTHRETRGRRAIAFTTLGAGLFYVIPFIMAFFKKTDLAGWLFCAALAAASVAFFGSCFYFNRRVLT